MDENTNATVQQAQGEAPSAPRGESGSPRNVRWWWGVLAASAVMVPVGYLLALVIELPMFLGLFFFMLFGFLLGAVMFRTGRPLRPIQGASVPLGGLIVMGVGVASSLWFGCYNLPGAIQETAIKMPDLPADMTGTQIHRRMKSEVPRRLKEAYWPGGMVGYVRMAATNGRLEVVLRDDLDPIKYRQPLKPWAWTVRESLAIILLAFGLFSQIMAIRKPEQPKRSYEDVIREHPDSAF